MKQETFIDMLVKSIRRNSLRKAILYTWLISFVIGFILMLLGFGGGGAIAEMYSAEFGFFLYFAVCCFHCIGEKDKSKKIVYLAGGGLILFFSSLIFSTSDNDLLSYMYNYDGEDAFPLFSFAVSLWMILQNTLGMLTLLAGTGLHIYAGWEASKVCEKRYRYLFYITQVAYSALLLMLLLLITSDSSIWYSNSVYFLLTIWFFSPAAIFFSAVIREGKSSIPSEVCDGEKEQETCSNDIAVKPDEKELDKPEPETFEEEQQNIKEVSTLISSDETESSQSPSHTESDKEYVKAIAMIIGVALVFALIAFAVGSSNKSKDSDIDSLDIDSIEDTVFEPYYDNDYDNSFEEEEQSYDVNEGDIKKIVELTYGDDWYLSRDFKQLQNACLKTKEEGYICGPDFDCWWWNQDPDKNLYVGDVDIVNNDQVVVSVIADGSRLKVSMVREGDYWKYDDFTDSDNYSYKDMMISDLQSSY